MMDECGRFLVPGSFEVDGAFVFVNEMVNGLDGAATAILLVASSRRSEGDIRKANNSAGKRLVTSKRCSLQAR